MPRIVNSHSNGSSSSPPSLPTSPTHPARPFPSSPNPSATFDRKSVAQQSPQQHHQPQPHQPLQLTERQLQKQRARNIDINLDDAPPPSLRRSPSPIRQGSARAPVIEITNDTPPRRQWTPGHDVSSRTGNGPAFRTPSQSPERRAHPRPPVHSPMSPQQPAIPRISLPDRHHDNDDAPSIVVSGPRISVSAPGTPAISVSEASLVDHGPPAMSVSPPVAFSPPKISVTDSAPPQRMGPLPGGFGSRHTQIQESSPSPCPRGRTPGKRGLPPPPSPSNPMRTNGLSCGGCGGPIIGRIVSAMNQRWHPHCFKCSVCNELLEHVSSYEHDGRPYCHLDYHEVCIMSCVAMMTDRTPVDLCPSLFPLPDGHH